LAIYYFKENYLNHFTSTKDKQGNTYIIKHENLSYYGNLKVVGVKLYNKKNISFYKLFQNGTTQNTIDINGNSLSTYTHILNALSHYSEKGDTLILGFGGGIVPKELSKRNFNIDVVEINPATLNIAERFFKYKKNNTNFFFEDARIFVKKCKKKYDLIIVDLFFEDGSPEHLITVEFYKDLKNCLKDEGILISNSIADFSDNLTLNTILSTFNAVFKNIYYFYDNIYVDQAILKTTNLYILASNKKGYKKIDIKLENVPNNMLPKILHTLNNINKFKKENFNKENVLFDENNRYSKIFSKSLASYRKLISNVTPSRILMN
jgi:spermidine synthase